MSLAAELAYGLSQLIEDQYGLITYRAITTLTGANPAPNPPTTVNALKLKGAAVTGAVTLDLTAMIFIGRLITGDRFTLDGDPTIYTVTAPTTSSTTSNDLDDLPFDPPLVQDAADETAVTLESFAADTVNVKALITDLKTRLRTGETVVTGGHRVRFLATSLSVDPEIGHIVILPDGEMQKVVEVSHLENQGVHYGWALQVGA